MALPKGWDETVNEWRVRLRSPGRFVRIRPKELEGVSGVYMVGGPLKPGDREKNRHARGAFVPQALRFRKREWPSLTAAVGWFEASRFAGGELDNPPRYGRRPRSKGKAERLTVHADYWIESSTSEELAADPGSPYRMVTTGGQRYGLSVLDAIRAQKEGLEYRGRGTPPAENPPRHRGQLRLGSFRAGVDEAIARLVKTDTELTALMAQALELSQRGAPVPVWILERARGLQLERVTQLEAVKTAVARHGAAIEEFSTPRIRRANPARARADAVRMFKQFHGGRPPTGYRFQRVPDLSQLVTLGRAVLIDYQLEPHVARGARNTPYRHAFSRGSTLLTDPTGSALVIVGNLKVSRSPRGRFGYIRAASEV